MFCALALTLWGTAAAALNPRDVDILGLRLGMTREDVIARLLAQGIPRVSIQDDQGECPGPSTAACIDRMTAPTRDGTLLIRFSAATGATEPTVWSIAYTLAGRMPGEPDMIRAAVLDHLGPPTGGTDPVIWCAQASGSECSPADQPQITFRRGAGTSSTLTLIDPTAVIRAGP